MTEQKPLKKAEVLTDFHYHRHYELSYILSGCCRCVVGNRAFRLEAGNILLVEKNSLHLYSAINDVSCKYITVCFAEDYIRPQLLRSCFKQSCVRIPEEKREYTGMLFEQLYMECREKKLLSEENYRNLVGMLLILVYRETYIPSNPVCPDTTNTEIDYALRYVAGHFCQKLTLSELAGNCHMNPSYFSRLFKKEVGINLNAYINALRIKEAALLLRTTDLNISEISERCGFASIEHFCSRFKQMEGIAASEYRKKQKP